MAPIPPRQMLTIDAIDQHAVATSDSENRAHLGASLIGRECTRALWYVYRWSSDVQHAGRLLRLFARGQREEAVFIELLRAIGITVWDTDPDTGQQFNYRDVGGHFGGSMDAVSLGLFEAPKTAHVCEFKTHNAKSFAALKEKGVQIAKPEHYAQMICYMHWSKLTRAYYLAVNKDTDELYSERIHADEQNALRLIEKAKRIITAQEPPARLSDRPDWYICQWCEHHEICHDKHIPQANCRTCAHSTPELDGDARWSCAWFGCDLSVETQRQGSHCPAHIFIPALVPWKATDASEDEGWVEYDAPTGTLRNGPSGVSSSDLALAGDPVFRKLEETF